MPYIPLIATISAKSENCITTRAQIMPVMVIVVKTFFLPTKFSNYPTVRHPINIPK